MITRVEKLHGPRLCGSQDTEECACGFPGFHAMSLLSARALPNVKACALAESWTEANLCSVDSPWKLKDASLSTGLPSEANKCQASLTTPALAVRPLAAPRTRPVACRHELAWPLTLRLLGPAHPSMPAQAHPRARHCNPQCPRNEQRSSAKPELPPWLVGRGELNSACRALPGARPSHDRVRTLGEP